MYWFRYNKEAFEVNGKQEFVFFGTRIFKGASEIFEEEEKTINCLSSASLNSLFLGIFNTLG